MGAANTQRRKAPCADEERTHTIERSCMRHDRCACATGLARSRHRCAELSVPAQCSLARFPTNGSTGAAAAARLRRGTLVEACPIVGPYGSGASEWLVDHEFALPSSGGSSSSAVLPLGACAFVRMTPDANAANVALELLGKSMLLVATRPVAQGEELRAAAATAPCQLRPPALRKEAVPPRAVRDICPPIEVRPSPLHGLGVFATAALAAGSQLAGIACPVVLGSLDRYTFAHAQLSRETGVNVQTTSLGPCSLVNHACGGRPNAAWSFEGDQQLMRVVRNVSADEELLWDYGFDYLDRVKLCGERRS